MTRITIALAATLLAACTKHVAGVYCISDSDCTTPGFTFCDLDGQYPESGYQKNTCCAQPQDCPVDRCGCSPNAVLSCAGSDATVCGSDGMSSSEQSCTLGCEADGSRCVGFMPSNELGSAFADAMFKPDVQILDGATIDTDSGTITAANGQRIAARSVIVVQPTDAPAITAFEASSFVVGNVTVVGSNALALVSSGSIMVQGSIDAAAKQGASGPGGLTSTSSSIGTDNSGGLACPASAGGGNATAGGAGGGIEGETPTGGVPTTGFVPLVGGGRGGDILNGTTITGSGGGGGGAIQLVSGLSVTIGGVVNVGGGGGGPSCGGGAGGLVIVESPTLNVTPTGGVVANGGGGGGCGDDGPDAGASATPAQLSSCTNAGTGGTGSAAPTSAPYCPTSPPTTCGCTATTYAGGGGASGRVHVVTRDGTYESAGLISAVVTTAMLTLD
jgi:hypothetical protein